MSQKTEKFFHFWGTTVASNPWKVILATVALTGLCSLGLLNFTSERNAWRVWLPEGSRFSIIQEWKERHFIEDTRATITHLTHTDNVLTPDALLLLLDLHEKVKAVQFEGGNYTRACLKIPITNILLGEKLRRRRRHDVEIEASPSRPIDAYGSYKKNYDYFNFYGTDEEEEYEDKNTGDDEMEGLPRDVYCDIVETMEDKCGEYSLLEIWNYDKEIISNLSQHEIINAINTVDESPIFGYKTNFTHYLGQAEYNSTGHVVRAKAIRSIWLEQLDVDNLPKTDGELLGAQFELVDPFTLGYEHEVLKVLKAWKNEKEEENNGYSLYMTLGMSFGNEANLGLEHDSKRQVLGYMFMFVYTLLNLGKLNMVENKCYLAAAGIMSVFFGVIVGVALTAALGFPYTPLSGLLPFICLGVGIDDIFVIVRCFNNIPAEEKKANSIVTNMGTTMKQAGAAITVTSATDICAFATGAMISFPGVQSLCISAALSITAIYLFQVTWFVAWMVLDEKRIDQKRNGIFPFIVHKDWKPQNESHLDIVAKILKHVSRLFEFSSFQAFIIVITLAMFSVGVWGMNKIVIGYDGYSVADIVPRNSYFKAWFDQNKLDFPSDGYGVTFFTAELSYTMEDFEKVEMIVQELDNLTRTHTEWLHYGTELPQSVQTIWEISTGFWWSDLKIFITHHKLIKDWRKAITKGHFPIYLSDFLHHEDGAIYKNHFRFSGNLTCNLEAPPIVSNKLGTLKFRDLQRLEQVLPARQAIDDILSKANFSNNVISESVINTVWEIGEIVVDEFHINVLMALGGVSLIVLITLHDLRGWLLTLICVLLTLVDIVGVMYLSGMIIEATTETSLFISIGLSVDYAAHIAHSFTMAKGTKKQRAISGFISISPAILHGGTSTILALAPIAFSETLPFFKFFKMTAFTVIFGLFHGLLFLPVMLSLFGADNETKE